MIYLKQPEISVDEMCFELEIAGYEFEVVSENTTISAHLRQYDNLFEYLDDLSKIKLDSGDSIIMESEESCYKIHIFMIE